MDELDVSSPHHALMLTHRSTGAGKCQRCATTCRSCSHHSTVNRFTHSWRMKGEFGVQQQQVQRFVYFTVQARQPEPLSDEKRAERLQGMTWLIIYT